LELHGAFVRDLGNVISSIANLVLRTEQFLLVGAYRQGTVGIKDRKTVSGSYLEDDIKEFFDDVLDENRKLAYKITKLEQFAQHYN
jgi:hypothetical protein